jgi:hypothetical protein
MLEAFWSVNWLAVVAAVLAHFFLGAAWFMGLVGKRYGVALGRTDLDDAKPTPLAIAGPFVCSVVTIATSAILMRALDVTTVTGGALFGLFVGVGYLTPMVTNIAINPNFPRPFFYTALNAPFFVLGSVVASVIVTAMS